MSFGLQLRDSGGAVYFDSGANSLRTMSYAEITVSGPGASYDLGAGFDSSRELVFVYEKTPSNNGVPFFNFSGTSLVFDAGSAGSVLIVQRVRFK